MPRGIILFWNRLSDEGKVLREEPPATVEVAAAASNAGRTKLSRKAQREAKKSTLTAAAAAAAATTTTTDATDAADAQPKEKEAVLYELYDAKFADEKESQGDLEGARVEFEVDQYDQIIDGTLRFVETSDISEFLGVSLKELRKYSPEAFSTLVITKGTQPACLPPSKKWKCPFCPEENQWFEDIFYDRGEITTCRKCAKDKPLRSIITRENFDKAKNLTTYELKSPDKWPTPENERALLDQLRQQGKKFTTLDEILKKADDKWEEAVAETRRHNICLVCRNRRSSEGKGCCINLKEEHCPMVSFSRYYGLNGTHLGACDRRKSLIELLFSLDPCICGLKSVPQFPHNVFRLNASAFNARAAFENKRDAIRVESDRLHDKKYVAANIKGVDPNMLCHVVPLAATGCWQSPHNIVPILSMCRTCQHLDHFFTGLQGKYPDGVPEGK